MSIFVLIGFCLGLIAGLCVGVLGMLSIVRRLRAQMAEIRRLSHHISNVTRPRGEGGWQ